MKYLKNTALGVILLVAAFSLNGIYGNGVMGFLANGFDIPGYRYRACCKP